MKRGIISSAIGVLALSFLALSAWPDKESVGPLDSRVRIFERNQWRLDAVWIRIEFFAPLRRLRGST
jgi:hypothetical protein